MGIEGSLSDKLASDKFEFQLTNGAVFGFFAGLIAFIACYLGERVYQIKNATLNVDKK